MSRSRRCLSFTQNFAAASLLSSLLFTAMVAAANERLIVLNKNDHTLAVVDPVSLKVLGKVPTGVGPHEAAITADGRFAVVANYGAAQPGNSLSIIDIDAIKEVRRHDLGALRRPHGIAQFADKIFFTSETSRTVGRYDPTTDKVDWIMGTGATLSHMLALSADGRRLYTSNIGSNNVTALRLDGPPNNANLIQIAVGPQPEAIDVSPDGAEVWVGHNGDGGISVIDTASNTVKSVIKVGQLPIRLKFSPDGKQVLVSDPKGGEGGNGEAIIIDAASRNIAARIAMPGVPLGIQFAPDGLRAYVSRTQAKSVDVIDMKTRKVIGSVETGDGPDGLAWRGKVVTAKASQ